MYMKNARKSKNTPSKNPPKDVNAKRRRISVDEEGKPLLKDNARKGSPPNYKTTRLDENIKESNE
jgi:hypothetical protein